MTDIRLAIFYTICESDTKWVRPLGLRLNELAG
jgi:hypothetical protein